MAQISACNGIWTNKPCEKETTTNKKSTQSSAVDETLTERRRLYTDVDLETFRARRDGRGDISITSARDACIGETPSLELCRKETSTILEKLQSLKRELDAQKIEREKKEALEKQADKKEETKITIINNTNTINFNNRRDDKNRHDDLKNQKPSPTKGPNEFRIK